MKVCHITTVHARYDIRIFAKECISLAEAGHEVTLIVNDEGGEEWNRGVRIVSLGSAGVGLWDRFISRRLRKQAYRMALNTDSDLYHFHDPELLPVGMRLLREGKKVVYDAHEDTPRQIAVKEWIPKCLRVIIAWAFEAYENGCARKFHGIIVPTPHLKTRFDKINPEVWVASNFPSLSEIDCVPESYSVDNPTCYVGDLTHTRGIREIAAATRLANKELVLCGRYYSEGLEDYINKEYDHVTYKGYLSRSEIAGVLTNSSMGFVTLHYTQNDAMSYPIKLFEYMAAGIPVIASDFPVYRSIIDEYECGLCVDPSSVEEISAAVLRLTEDRELSAIMGINGRRAIESRYNWESESKRLLEAYDILQRGRP